MRHRRLLLKLSTGAIAFTLAIFVAELIVRIYCPQQPSWLDVFAKSDSPAYGLQPSTTRIISTGETTWSIYTDSSGYRCPKEPASADKPELLILGDSFTFGMGVNYEQSIPGCLAAALPDLHIVNTGVPGYGPTQYRQILQRELDHHAPIKGVILLTFIGNDFHDCLMTKGNVRDGLLGNEQTVRAVLKRNSHLYRLAASAYHKLPSNSLEHRPHEWELYREDQWTTGVLKPALDIYNAEMKQIADLCAAHQIPLLGCIIPSPHAVQIAEGSAKPDANERFDLPANRAMSAFAAADIRAIDLTPDLAKARMARVYFGWDEHLNPTGNQLAASAVVSAWRTAAATAAP